jgi:hypothetical protein
MQAECHPERPMHARRLCWPCYSKEWRHPVDPTVKDGIWAEYRRAAQGKPKRKEHPRKGHGHFVERPAGRSGPVTRLPRKSP